MRRSSSAVCAMFMAEILVALGFPESVRWRDSNPHAEAPDLSLACLPISPHPRLSRAAKVGRFLAGQAKCCVCQPVAFSGFADDLLRLKSLRLGWVWAMWLPVVVACAQASTSCSNGGRFRHQHVTGTPWFGVICRVVLTRSVAEFGPWMVESDGYVRQAPQVRCIVQRPRVGLPWLSRQDDVDRQQTPSSDGRDTW